MVNTVNQSSAVLFGTRLRRDIPFDQFRIKDPQPYVISGTDGENRRANIAIDSNILSRHIMLIGGIGTGKTNAFFQILSRINTRLTNNDMMIIFDTKGDFLQEFYRPGDVVISNDETATGSKGLDYWNIFNEIDYGPHMNESVIEVAKSLFAEKCKKTTQIFFPNAAKDLFMACMLHFIRSKPPRERTNKNLINYISSTPAAEIKEMLLSYDDLKALSSYIEKTDSAQTQGVLSELQQTVREIFVGNFAKTGTLALKSLVRKKGGRKVFIEYDLSIGKMLSPVYSLMFDMAIKEALGRKRTQGNVYFITDEFRLLPNLEHVDDAVNFGRSLGIKFMIGIQNVEQIYESYGEERARSIMSGFLTSFAFRVNDAKSREYIQQLYGKNQKVERYIPLNQSKGIVETQRESNVVEDWDVSNLRIGEAILGFPNVEPFIFRFEEYIPRK
ncbi:MAG: type IV secretion system DNA-binding domain-containing protein [Clostridia bacterium]|nr:type IV secretion system DNA-binding domain-containing protein [Clostridia bacterium]MBQ3938199.1 type IV secretion system DNA-binding domain-containing protein [Clostridia bacterium]